MTGVDLARWYCEHSHTGLKRPVRLEKCKPQRMGYFEIKASQLKALFGFIISWALKPVGINKMDSYVLTKEDYERKGEQDEEAICRLVADMVPFDTSNACQAYSRVNRMARWILGPWYGD